MKMQKLKNLKLDMFIVMLAFLFYFLWSVTLPYNTGPDEYMRYQIPQYIYEFGKLPHGGDPIIRNEIWGISYGFTPIFSYIISALFMKIVSVFNQSNFALLTAARFVSVMCSTVTVYMCIKIGELIFNDKYKYLLAIMVGFLPQFIFISSYVNNDSIAILAISIIIYNWLLGFKSKWNVKSCIGLSIGISLSALSYYNAYGYILCSIILFIVSVLAFNKDKGFLKYRILFKKGLMISAIVLILIGWWFIRSYIIYDGDILGLKTTNIYSEMYAREDIKPSNRLTPERQGISISYMLINMGWIKSSWHSFIGVFDYMSLPVFNWMYFLFDLLTLTGLYGIILKFSDVLIRKDRLIDKTEMLWIYISMIIACFITIFLSIYYSYTAGFQPQGRYCMPIIIPFMIFITIGIKKIMQKMKKENLQNILYFCLCISYILISLIVYTNIIIPAYYI